MKKRRGWMDVLRQTAELAPGLSRPQANLEEATLWSAVERLDEALKQTTTSAERMAASAARHRGALDAGVERGRLLSARAGDLSAGAGRMQAVFDRLRLVALNTGLEGARIADPAGRALVLVSDEVRTYATRGNDTSNELKRLIDEVAEELAQLQTQLDQARTAASEIGDEAGRAQMAVREAERASGELGQRLRQTTGTDPEVARALAEASAHARGLLGALSAISAHPEAGGALSALRPVLEPLVRTFGELADAGRGAKSGDE